MSLAVIAYQLLVALVIVQVEKLKQKRLRQADQLLLWFALFALVVTEQPLQNPMHLRWRSQQPMGQHQQRQQELVQEQETETRPQQAVQQQEQEQAIEQQKQQRS